MENPGRLKALGGRIERSARPAAPSHLEVPALVCLGTDGSMCAEQTRGFTAAEPALKLVSVCARRILCLPDFNKTKPNPASSFRLLLGRKKGD